MNSLKKYRYKKDDIEYFATCPSDGDFDISWDDKVLKLSGGSLSYDDGWYNNNKNSNFNRNEK